MVIIQCQGFGVITSGHLLLEKPILESPLKMFSSPAFPPSQQSVEEGASQQWTLERIRLFSSDGFPPIAISPDRTRPVSASKAAASYQTLTIRSEERRVGKEVRSR